MTVAELVAELENVPQDATVHAYEGEGGSWIIVLHEGMQAAEFSVDAV